MTVLETRDRAIAIMAKAPRPDHAKTRLRAAADLESQVVALYRCFVEDTLSLAGSVDNAQVAIVCPTDDAEQIAAWLPSVRAIAQRGHGLAAGLTSAFAVLHEEGCRRIVALNGDSPHLPGAILNRAFELLGDSDVVIGPTEDGGYYLVALKAPRPALFDAGTLGTASALAELCARAQALNLSVAFTETCYDVDAPHDLARLVDELRDDPQRAPRTAALLSSMAGEDLERLQCR